VRLFAAYVAVAITVCLCIGERCAKVVARVDVRLPITRTRYRVQTPGSLENRGEVCLGCHSFSKRKLDMLA
jgi:hypothetical protein